MPYHNRKKYEINPAKQSGHLEQRKAGTVFRAGLKIWN